jgi:hypothetical protein
MHGQRNIKKMRISRLQWWKSADRVNSRYTEINLHYCHFLTTNRTYIGLGLYPVLRCDKPTTSCLNSIIVNLIHWNVKHMLHKWILRAEISSDTLVCSLGHGPLLACKQIVRCAYWCRPVGRECYTPVKTQNVFKVFWGYHCKGLFRISGVRLGDNRSIIMNAWVTLCEGDWI